MSGINEIARSLKNTKSTFFDGKIISVDESKNTCVVEIFETDETLQDVRLKPIADSTKLNVLLIPTADKNCVVCKISEDNYYLIECEEVAKIYLGGNTNGLGLTDIILQKLNNIENKINATNASLKAHTHTANNVVSAQLAGLTDLTVTTLSDISSTKIKY